MQPLSTVEGLLDVVPDAAIAVEPGGRIVAVNALAETMFGYTAEELVGQLVEVLVPESFRAVHPGHRGRFGEHPRTRPMGAGLELLGRRHDGSVFPVDIMLRPLDVPGGRLVVAAVRDVTDRKRAEGFMRIMREAATASNEAASLTDALRRCLAVVCEETGWEAGHAYLRDEDTGELTPLGSWQLDDPSRFLPLRRASVDLTFERGEGVTGRVLESGGPIWVEDFGNEPGALRAKPARESGAKAYFAVPVTASGDEVVAVMEFFSTQVRGPDLELLEVMTNLGAQLGRVAERSRSRRALQQAYERERNAAESLRAVDELKTSFLHAVSHELRTPLAAVLGFSEILNWDEAKLPRDEARMVAGKITANARELDRLLTDLLDLDRLSRGVLEPNRQKTELGPLVREVLARVDLGDRPVELAIGVRDAYVDPAHLERILENLLVNAARHTPEGTRVWVRCDRARRGVEFVVEDDGPGVPDEIKAEVFEAFRRGQTHARGTGIGLSLVTRFAELHGGRAWVEDRPGGGACFRVLLPG